MSSDRYPHFRLNLEQQQKRAKELLRAARSGDASALAKFRQGPPKLAEAQFAIARELRFENWATLKRRVAAMTRERSRLEQDAHAPVHRKLALDGALRTLHIRCGSDLRRPLQDAGFRVARERVFMRQSGVDREGRARPPWTDVLTLTELGRAVLAGEADFQSLAPPPRWVGGVRISQDDLDWRWDESRRDAVPGPAKSRSLNDALTQRGGRAFAVTLSRSVARAPLRMFGSARLPSWHAYSNIP